MRFLLLICVLALTVAAVSASDLAPPYRPDQPAGSTDAPSAVQISTTTISIPTYPYADFLSMEHSYL